MYTLYALRSHNNRMAMNIIAFMLWLALLAGLTLLASGIACAQDNQNSNMQNQDSTMQNSGNTASGNAAASERDTALDDAVKAKLAYCQEHYHSCKTSTSNAAGILVFPDVVKADLLVGGSGGKGALVEHGKITGYYSIGSGSAGLQAGFQDASQIYVFPTEQSMESLKKGSTWKVGDTAGVTVMAADANVHNSTGNIKAFIFDSRGLHAGVSVDLFDIWKTGARPS